MMHRRSHPSTSFPRALVSVQSSRVWLPLLVHGADQRKVRLRSAHGFYQELESYSQPSRHPCYESVQTVSSEGLAMTVLFPQLGR